MDPGYDQLIPRIKMDQFFVKNKILSDSKEMNSFLSGTLQLKEGLDVNQKVRKSHFLSLVYKSILRKGVMNIMTFCKIGNDFVSDTASLKQ